MNINFTELERLIKLAEISDINSLEVVDGNKRISIICHLPNDNHNESYTNKPSFKDDISVANHEEIIGTQGETKVHDSKILDDTSQNQVTAPMLGTFYSRPEPGAKEFVQNGDKVTKGQTLCVIEAMKIMHEVKADCIGVVKDILVQEGDVVEFGQPLFTIDSSTQS